MRYIKIFQVIVISYSLFLGILSANPIIDIGEISREAAEPVINISILSKSEEISALAKRAFHAHGGYKLSDRNGDIQLTLEAFGSNELSITLLTVEKSGQEGRIQFTGRVKGIHLNDATLKACDLAVKQTLGIPGFFSGKITFVGKRNGKSELFTGDLFFKNIKQLTSDKADLVFPKWSPDGSKIIYTSYYKTGFPDIFVLDPISGEKNTVAAYSGTNIGGVFSPNGEKIAMVLSSSGIPEIYIANPNGHRPKRLTQSKGLKAAPCWSSDGTKIYFSSDALGSPQIHVIDINGSGMKRIPTNISKYCDEPMINPVKSNELAFTAATSRTFQIGLFDFDSQKSKFITQGNADHIEPCWLNDGRHLIVTCRSKALQELYIIDSKTGKKTPLHSKDFGHSSMSSFIYK